MSRLLFVPTRVLFDPQRLVIRVWRVTTNRNHVATKKTGRVTKKEPVTTVPRPSLSLQTPSGMETRRRCTTICDLTIVLNRSRIVRPYWRRNNEVVLLFRGAVASEVGRSGTAHEASNTEPGVHMHDPPTQPGEPAQQSPFEEQPA